MEFFLETLGNGVVAALLLGAVSWLFKTQIAHSLNKDLAKVQAGYQKQLEEAKSQYQHDLEKAKSTYQHELESYRTSLIAHVEGVKATQDVRKAVALRMAEKKFHALEQLDIALRDQAANSLALLIVQDSPAKAAEIQHIGNSIASVRLAIGASQPFLQRAESVVMIELLQAAVQAATTARDSSTPVPDAIFQDHRTKLLALQGQADGILARYFDDMTAVTQPLVAPASAQGHG